MRFGRDEPGADSQVPTRIDHLEGVIADHIREDLIPRISEHHRISQAVEPIEFLYYNRLEFGRTCSCWKDENSEDDYYCEVCFGTGIPGGFKKWGCVWDVLDTTATVNTVNITPNFGIDVRPVPFGLANNAVHGWIDWVVPLSQNVGLLDALRLGASEPKGSRVQLLIRGESEQGYTLVTGKSEVESRLGETKLHFRIELSRAPKSKSPQVSVLHFRYRIRKDIAVVVNTPRDERSITLSDMGLYDSWQTSSMVFGKGLPNLGVNDFFVRITDASRWKLTTLSPYTPMGHLVGYDGTARLVQRFENYSKIP